MLPLKPLQSGVVVPLLAEVPKYERSPPACILSVPHLPILPVHSNSERSAHWQIVRRDIDIVRNVLIGRRCIIHTIIECTIIFHRHKIIISPNQLYIIYVKNPNWRDEAPKRSLSDILATILHGISFHLPFVITPCWG